MKKKMSGFACMECGRRFKTARAAHKALFDGCPQCNATDIDLETAYSTPAPVIPEPVEHSIIRRGELSREIRHGTVLTYGVR